MLQGVEGDHHELAGVGAGQPDHPQLAVGSEDAGLLVEGEVAEALPFDVAVGGKGGSSVEEEDGGVDGREDGVGVLLAAAWVSFLGAVGLGGPLALLEVVHDLHIFLVVVVRTDPLPAHGAELRNQGLLHGLRPLSGGLLTELLERLSWPELRIIGFAHNPSRLLLFPPSSLISASVNTTLRSRAVSLAYASAKVGDFESGGRFLECLGLSGL